MPTLSPSSLSESSLPSPRGESRPSRDHTQILLDWDDSILPTSFLAHSKLRIEPDCVIDSEAKFALEELDRVACGMITKALDLARHVAIVTNAEDDWIEQSSRKFLPGVYGMLSRLEVVSARSKHEIKYPGSTDVWKRVEFLQRVASLSKLHQLEFPVPQDKRSTDDELFGVQAVLQMISIGDSEYERAALWAVKTEHPHILVKSIKLLNAPTIVALKQQLTTITTSFESIVNSHESLDLKLHAGKSSSSSLFA